MLSYTIYAADEFGKITTWDLKAVLVSLIHMCVCALLLVDSHATKTFVVFIPAAVLTRVQA